MSSLKNESKISEEDRFWKALSAASLERICSKKDKIWDKIVRSI